MVATWILYGAAGLILFFGGFLGGFTAQLVFNYHAQKEIMALRNKMYSPNGVAARQEKAERMENALMEVAQLVQQGKKPEDALKEIAVKYPDVAVSLATKFLKQGGLGNLIKL